MKSPDNKVEPAEVEEGKEARSEVKTPRDVWPRKTGTLFALLSYTVNVHCLWDLPGYCFRNGGVAFFLPYILTMLFCCLPLYMTKMKFGQHCGTGCLSRWKWLPVVKGLGYAATYINFTVTLYYAVYAAWGVYYLLASIRSQLLWHNCDGNQTWIERGTYHLKLRIRSEFTCFPCTQAVQGKTIPYHTITLPYHLFLYQVAQHYHGIARHTTHCDLNTSDLVHSSFGTRSVPVHIPSVLYNSSDNETFIVTSTRVRRTTDVAISEYVWTLPAHLYFKNEVLRMYHPTTDIDSAVGINYKLALSLLAVCVGLFFSLMKGARSVRKVLLITLPLSYALIALVLFRAVSSFDGAALGLSSYLSPNWSRLANVKVWGDAASLAFFTLFPTYGTVADIASHSPPNSKYREDTVLIMIGSLIGGFFYAFVISLLIGVLASSMTLPVTSFASTEDAGKLMGVFLPGPDLIFIAVAQSFTQLSQGPLWSCFFFASFLTLVFGTLLVVAQSVVESFKEICPFIRRGRHWKLVLIGIICCVVFLIDLVLICKIGIYVTVLLDRYCNWWNTIVLSCLELILLSHFSSQLYHTQKHTDDEPNSNSNRLIRVAVQFSICASACILILITIYALHSYAPTRYGQYTYPVWAETIGWILTITPLLFVTVTAVKGIAGEDGDNYIEKLRNAFKPDLDAIENQGDLHDQLGDQKSAAQEELEVAPASGSGQPIFVVEPPPHNTVFVLPSSSADPSQKHHRISATEPAVNPGKVNRGTQMTRDIAAQTGDANGDGALVEYPEHYDHAEFTGAFVRRDSRRYKDKKDKYKKKERKKRKRDRSKDATDEERQQSPTDDHQTVPVEMHTKKNEELVEEEFADS